MATTIVTKNSSTASAVPTAGQLVQGELAVNVADKKLYTEDNAGSIIVLADGVKLAGIEALADVTDTANVTAAGALMDSELTNITAVKALNQGVATTDSPSFAGLTATTADINGGTIDGTTIGATTPASVAATTGTFSGVVTANAGVVVDNFTLDGTTLALSSGDMTLDSASQIILDAAGGNFQFLKSGTEFARFFESGSDFYIYNPISDKDIKFYGNDGGTSFTALTLDMSAAGAATFNNNVTSNAAFIAASGVYTNNGIIYGNATGIQLKDSSARELATFHGTGLGTSNVAIGVNAGNSIESGGNYNVLVGDEAGTAITTGDGNVAIGYVALQSEDTGSRSIAIGYSALQNQNNDANNYNVAVGHEAGGAVTTGTNNTLIGGLAGDAITTGAQNTAVGKSALSANTTGAENTAVGMNALQLNTTASNNTAVGRDSLVLNTTGANNTANGYASLLANTTASNNTAVGYAALTANTTGTENVAVGANALEAVTTGYENIGVGRGAGSGITTGNRNTFIGDDAGYLITGGSENTILGRFNGASGGLDISTASNYIVLSDGGGNVRSFWDNAGNMYMHTSGSGIYIGGASSANLLDDYEEGTWTPALGGTWTTNPTNLSGTYTKVGNIVYITVTMTGGVKSSAISGYLTGVPINIGTGTGSVSDSSVADFGNCLFQNGNVVWLTATNLGTGTVYITGTYLAT
jgi:hypothetical protein